MKSSRLRFNSCVSCAPSDESRRDRPAWAAVPSGAGGGRGDSQRAHLHCRPAADAESGCLRRERAPIGVHVAAQTELSPHCLLFCAPALSMRRSALLYSFTQHRRQPTIVFCFTAEVLTALRSCAPALDVASKAQQTGDSAAHSATLSAGAPHSSAAVRVASAIARAEPPRVLWGGAPGAECLARLLAASVLHSPARTAALALEPWCERLRNRLARMRHHRICCTSET